MKKYTTVPEVLEALKKHKPMSRETLYGYIRRFQIKPLGVRQRPQLYPGDTAKRILSELGLR